MKEQNRIPCSLLSEILTRFLTPTEFEDLLARYRDARNTSGAGYYEPTTHHISLWNKWLRKELTIKECSEAMDCTTSTVHQRFAAISRLALQDNLSAIGGKWKI